MPPAPMNQGGTDQRIVVLGAGVIGQVHAALLHESGANVTLLARGRRRAELQAHGVQHRCEHPRSEEKSVPVPVADVAEPITADVVLLAVRAQELPTALETVSRLGQPIVVPLMHLTDQRAELEQAVGVGRLALAFPGIGGYREDSGLIVWAQVRQQPTTIDGRAPAHRMVREILAGTGIKTAAEPRMADWMNTHTIFISCLSAAIIRAGGDPVRAARDPEILNSMVDAIRDGFQAYRKRGGRVRPGPLGMLFGPVPKTFAARYWKRELQGAVGKITLAPHTRNSEFDEVPLICKEAVTLLGGDAPVLGQWLAPLVR